MKAMKILPLLAAGVLLAACGRNNGNNSGTPPPAQQSVTLNTLVRNAFSNTSDTAEPTPINNLKIDITSEDSAAYNDLLKPTS